MPTIHITTKPGKSQDGLWREGDSLVAHIKIIPENVEPNDYLEGYLAERFGCSKNRVSIVKGRTSPHKTVAFLQDERVFQMKLSEIPALPQQSLFE